MEEIIKDYIRKQLRESSSYVGALSELEISKVSFYEYTDNGKIYFKLKNVNSFMPQIISLQQILGFIYESKNN